MRNATGYNSHVSYQLWVKYFLYKKKKKCMFLNIVISLKVAVSGRHMWDYFPQQMDHGIKRGRTDRIQESAWWEEAWRAHLRSHERRQRFWAETAESDTGATCHRLTAAPCRDERRDFTAGTRHWPPRRQVQLQRWHNLCASRQNLSVALITSKVVSMQLLLRPLSDKSLLLCFFP